MKISKLPNCPDWLKIARTEGADVTFGESGRIVWHGGVWHGGDWHGGVWCGGDWHDGDWHGGVWFGGDWRDGVWRGGDWHGGVWYGGVWHGGDWHGGVWCGGDWRDEKTDRLLFMSAGCGIVFGPDGFATAYRTTSADGHGRHTRTYMQVEGEYREKNLPPSGSGTCIAGIHVGTATKAHTLLGVDHTAQMWEVRFRREDLLDCDGEKARISGGFFRKIERPF